MDGKKKIIIIIVVALLVIIGTGEWLKRSTTDRELPKKLTPTIEQAPEQTEDLKEFHSQYGEDSLKMDEFVNSRLPEDKVNIFEIPDLNSDKDSDKKELSYSERDKLMKDEVIQMFFVSIQDEDMFTMSSFVTPQALQSAWNGETDADKRIQSVEDAIIALNRNKTLQSFEYSFEIGKYNKVQDNGVLTFKYSDGFIAKFPFQLSRTEGGEHEEDDELVYYFMDTPLTDILKYMD